MYPKMSPLVALLLQVTFTLYAFYRSYPRGLLVAESKEYIYIYIYIYMVKKWIFALR